MASNFSALCIGLEGLRKTPLKFAINGKGKVGSVLN